MILDSVLLSWGCVVLIHLGSYLLPAVFLSLGSAVGLVLVEVKWFPVHAQIAVRVDDPLCCQFSNDILWRQADISRESMVFDVGDSHS